VAEGAGAGEGALAAAGEALAAGGADAVAAGGLVDHGELGLEVGGEDVEGDDDGEAEEEGRLEVLLQVGEAALEGGGVGLGGGGELGAAVDLEGAEGGDEDEGTGPDAGGAALDVEEFLAAEVEAEAGLGDGVVAGGEPEARRQDGAAPVGDVAEGAGVDQGRAALGRLHQVGEEGVAEERGHGGGGAHVAGGDGGARRRGADDHAGEALLQVLVALGEGDDGHDLAGGGDVEAVLAGDAVGAAAEAEDHVAEGPIVHVEGAAPGDAARVERALLAERDAEVAGVVGHRREEVVGGGDGVDVAGEVEVDVVGRDQRRLPAARAPALHAEDGPERGLAQAEGGALAEAAHAHRQAHRGRRLPLPRGRGVDGRDQHQPAPPRGGQIQRGELDLGLAAAADDDPILRDRELAGDVEDGLGGVGAVGVHPSAVA
jgi:hypothetical protein